MMGVSFLYKDLSGPRRVDGKFTVRGGWELDMLRVDGKFTVRGGRQLDMLRVDGKFTVRGGR
jgi:hypothetical protein